MREHDAIIEDAYRASPEPFLRSFYGNELKMSPSGRSLAVKGVLRADYKNGRWVACDWSGGGIGGSVNIIRHVYNVGFKDAVELLTGQSFSDPVRAHPAPQKPRLRRKTEAGPPQILRVPDFVADKTEGRAYLQSRGVFLETIMRCEHEGSLAYTKNGLCFLGRNEMGAIRYVAHRFYREQEAPDGSMRTKKDEVNSSKTYTFNIQPKTERYATYLVEGGINALSLHDLLSRCGEDAFIVTTGSVSARGWMKNPATLARIAKSTGIVMICENESAGKRATAERKQYETDGLRLKVLNDLRDALGEENALRITLAYPPVGYGDINDYMAHYAQEESDKTEAYIASFVARIEEAESLESYEERYEAMEPPPILLIPKPIATDFLPKTYAPRRTGGHHDVEGVHDHTDRSEEPKPALIKPLPPSPIMRRRLSVPVQEEDDSYVPPTVEVNKDAVQRRPRFHVQRTIPAIAPIIRSPEP